MPRRSVDTKIFSDNWFTNLDPTERYLFLYFLLNDHTTLCGIYELPLRVMAFESGLDMTVLNTIIARFSKDRKVHYYEGWVYVVNYEKYQIMNSNMKLNAGRSRDNVPVNVRLYLEALPNCSEQFGNNKDKDRDKDIHKDNKGGLGEKLAETKKLTPKEIAINFFNQVNSLIEDRPDEAKELQVYLRGLSDKGIPKDILWEEVKKFTDYWTETNKAGTKQLWELQKTFEVNRRLLRWFRNANRFKISGSNFTKRTKTIIE